jgi:hypothetical protein
MPQLDIYTFPTQIYFFSLFFFFSFIFMVKFLFTLWFKYELLEKEEIRTFDESFAIETSQHNSQKNIPLRMFPVLEKFLINANLSKF